MAITAQQLDLAVTALGLRCKYRGFGDISHLDPGMVMKYAEHVSIFFGEGPSLTDALFNRVMMARYNPQSVAK